MKKGVTLIPSSGHLKQSIFYPIVFVALSLFMFCFLVLENIENIENIALARKQNVLLPSDLKTLSYWSCQEAKRFASQ